jgi:branched-chain amino acid transport system substrate-binding protein
MRVLGRGRSCLLFLTVLAVGVVLAGCGATKSTNSAGSSGGGSSTTADTANAAKCGSGSVSSSSLSSTSVPGVPAANGGLSSYGQSAAGSCTYNGPGGYSLNVSNCPANWNINQGITNNSIDLFTSAPHSGALAAYGAIEDGAKSYFQYVNQHGGVDGRQINYTIMDDQYEPNLTAQNVQSADQSDKYATSFAIFGTPNALAVRQTMNAACQGEWMVAASDDEFSDPQQYPWTTGFGIDRYNETSIETQFLQSKFPSGAKVAMITMAGDLGQSYADGFTRAMKGTNLKIAGDEVFAATAPSITNQVTSAAATGAKVAVINVAGTYCTQAIADIEKSSWKPLIISPNTCAQISTSYAPLLAEGATGDGTYTNRYYYAPTDPDAPKTGAAGAYIALYTKTLKSQGLDPTNAQYANGWWWGWDFVQVLKDAVAMKGGLNRATINIAAHAYTSKWPLLMPGVEGHMDGITNAFPYQEDRVYEYTGATSKATGKFVPAAPLVDNTGKLHNYLYAQSHS